MLLRIFRFLSNLIETKEDKTKGKKIGEKNGKEMMKRGYF